MAIEHDLRKQYSDAALREIASAAKLHAEIIAKYGENKTLAKLYGDVYLSLSNLLALPKE